MQRVTITLDDNLMKTLNGYMRDGGHANRRLSFRQWRAHPARRLKSHQQPFGPDQLRIRVVPPHGRASQELRCGRLTGRGLRDGRYEPVLHPVEPLELRMSLAGNS